MDFPTQIYAWYLTKTLMLSSDQWLIANWCLWSSVSGLLYSGRARCDGKPPSSDRDGVEMRVKPPWRASTCDIHKTKGLLAPTSIQVIKYSRSLLQWHPWERPKSVTVREWLILCHCNQLNFTPRLEMGKSEKCHCNQMALYCVTVTSVIVSNFSCSMYVKQSQKQWFIYN